MGEDLQHTTWAPELLARAYYSDDSVVLVHGDCLELADVWTVADVLVTDPPYGMRYTTRGMVSIAGDQDVSLRDEALGEWGEAKPALVFGTWRQPRPPVHIRALLVWWKDNCPVGSGDTKMPFGPTHEEIYALGRDWVNPRRRTHERDRSHRAGAEPVHRTGSVFRTTMNLTGGNGLSVEIGHPTPKPVGLMSNLLEWCPPGVIADPFAGSGSTLVAAKALGRKAIGVELDERYCEIAARRLAQDVLNFEEPA